MSYLIIPSLGIRCVVSRMLSREDEAETQYKLYVYPLPTKSQGISWNNSGRVCIMLPKHMFSLFFSEFPIRRFLRKCLYNYYSLQI